MKIAFFANSYFPITYGSTISIENFRVGLEKLGHEVHIFVPRFWGYKYETKNIHLYPSIMFGYKIKYPIAICGFSNMTKKVSEIGFDIIHAQHPFSVGCDAMKIAKKVNVPLIFTHHAKYEEYTHYVPPIIPQKILKAIVGNKVTKFANNCDVCISPSQTIKEYMQERNITAPIEVLPTGIEWHKFQMNNNKVIKDELGITNKQKIIIFIGRIEAEKNIIFLIEEVFPILKENKLVKFLFVGDGSLVEKIKEKAQKEGVLKQLIFTGIIRQEKIAYFYSIADIFVHASLTETQGMTIAEAMATGLPIVAIKAPGVIDQLENQKTGIIISQKKGLFKKEIEKLLIDKKRCKEIGGAAKEKAKEFDNSIRVKQLENIYQKTIEKRNCF